MKTLIKTTNEQWGFYGTMKSNYGISDKTSEELFDLAARTLASKLKVTTSAAQAYLDAKDGRHLADSLSLHGAKNRASKLVLTKALYSYFSNKNGDLRHIRKSSGASQQETALINKMVAHISKRVCEELISEDLAHQISHELTQKSEFKNRPDLADDFMEACGIVESKVRKALGVKNGKN